MTVSYHNRFLSLKERFWMKVDIAYGCVMCGAEVMAPKGTKVYCEVCPDQTNGRMKSVMVEKGRKPMPQSDVPFDHSALHGHGPLTDTQGHVKDTSSDCGRTKGGIPALVPKYVVTKSDLSPTELEAVYWVLRLDNSPDDRDALLYYAARIRHVNAKLADDIKKLCESLES